jgi:pilus assembly protein Flp/PilA
LLQTETLNNWQPISLIAKSAPNFGDKNMYFIRKIIRSKRAATAIEYGLIAALIAVAAVSAMSLVGKKISTTFNNVNTNMKAS